MEPDTGKMQQTREKCDFARRTSRDSVWLSYFDLITDQRRHFGEWSKQSNRYAYRVLRNIRNRCIYPKRAHCVQKILMELQSVDQKIEFLQKEIYVLRLQLRIMKSEAIVAAKKR